MENFIEETIQKAVAGRFHIPFTELEIKKEVLGHGQFSEVHICKWRGLDIVIKKPINYTLENIIDFLNEVEVWSTVRHPNIAQFLGFSINSQNELFILMEHIKGVTLDVYLKSWFCKQRHVCEQLVKVLHFLHSCHPIIIYRDLKPDNIMIDKHHTVKLIDFGLSRFVDEEDLSENKKMTGKTGSLRYMAPEVFNNEVYNIKADIYSLGLVMLYVITKQRPLDNVDFENYIKSRTSLCINTYDQKWTKIIQKCVEFNPTDRPTTKAILKMLE